MAEETAGSEAQHNRFRYDPERYWGGFPPAVAGESEGAQALPDRAIGPFTKHGANPVLAPSPDGWDVGARGGVHNGATLRRNGKLYYVYRGWMPHPPTVYDDWLCGYFDWVCDIGLAVSDDGVHFVKDRDHSPFFRTGGHHSGHFYAIGEVRFSKKDLPRPIEWLPRPVLAADPSIPCEDGRDASPPHKSVSYFRDTVFFTGLTQHADQWWLYYGGSERYTCLAQAPVRG